MRARTRRGASLVTYATVIGLVALGVSVAVSQTGDQVRALTTRVASSVNAVDGAISGNRGPVYQSPALVDQTVAQFDPMTPIAASGFVDPEGDALKYSLSLTGGLQPEDFTVQQFPDGVVVDGTPGGSGTLAVVATDPIGRRATAGPISISVDPNRAPGFTDAGASPIAAEVDTPIAGIALGALSDPDPGDAIIGVEVTVTGPAPTPGLVVAGLAPVRLEGTPTRAGEYQVTLQATDEHGASATYGPFIVQVAPDDSSCLRLLETGGSTGDGVYTVDPDGDGGAAPVEAVCDMTNGGWTGVPYAADLPFANRWTSGDAHRWLPNDFDLAWPDQAIAALRNRSTEGRQTYVGLCEGSIHHDFKDTSYYPNAVSFELSDGSVLDTDPAAGDARLTQVSQDGCQWNGGEGGAPANATIFQINTLDLPIRNIQTFDNGASHEYFGSPLTQHPAWFK